MYNVIYIHNIYIYVSIYIYFKHEPCLNFWYVQHIEFSTFFRVNQWNDLELPGLIMLLHLNISTKCHMLWPFQKLFKTSSQIHLTTFHKTQVSNSKRSCFLLINLCIECVCCHDVRELGVLGSLLPPCGLWRLMSVLQGWQQVPLNTKSFCQSSKSDFSI